MMDQGIVTRAGALGERMRPEDGIGRAAEVVHTAFTSAREGRVMSMEIRDA
jgi:hypothetical protein